MRINENHPTVQQWSKASLKPIDERDLMSKVCPICRGALHIQRSFASGVTVLCATCGPLTPQMILELPRYSKPIRHMKISRRRPRRGRRSVA